MFRSAAQAYDARVIGILLSGGLNDGVAGLYEIKERGGVTIVQDPAEAVNGSMPKSALTHVDIDHCLPAQEIAELLIDLVSRMSIDSSEGERTTARPEEEVMTDYTDEQPIAVTCPDCGGALRRQERGSLVQYRCHIGHVYTAEVMLAAQFLAMEYSLGAAMRSLRERAELCRQMAEKSRSGHDHTTLAWDSAMQEAAEQAVQIGQVLEREWIKPDGTGALERSASV